MADRVNPRTGTYRGDAADRLAEVTRFLREHGDHGLRRFDGDEEFGYFDGFTCDTHEAELQLIPPVASLDPAPPPEPTQEPSA